MRRLFGWAVVGGIVWLLQDPLFERFGSNGAIAASAVIGGVTFPVVTKLFDVVFGEAASDR